MFLKDYELLILTNHIFYISLFIPHLKDLENIELYIRLLRLEFSRAL